MQKKTYLCPYCFTEHKRSHRCYRCMNVRCKKRPDLIGAQYSGRAPELKQLCFDVRERHLYHGKQAASCPECHSKSTMLVCPSCHNTLPPEGKNHRTYFVSVVGAMDAGKSSYLAVFLHEFKRKVACALHGTASFMDEASSRDYEERFLQYLFPWIGTNPSIRLPKTKSRLEGSKHLVANRPVMLRFRQSKDDGEKEETSYTFAFYDEAGEDFEEENVMFTISNHLAWSDAILFFFDPLAIPYIRNSLSEQVVKGGATSKPGEASDPNVILLRLAKVLREKENKKDEEGIDIPIAVIIPKLDILRPFLPNGSLLLRESMHRKEKAYVKQEGFDIHEELCGLMYEWGEQEFLAHLASNFTHFQLFSVSSLGNNPDEYGRFFSPRPVRVEDPFLWILKELKIIESI